MQHVRERESQKIYEKSTEAIKIGFSVVVLLTNTQNKVFYFWKARVSKNSQSLRFERAVGCC